jgi:hypothetical protein
LRLQGQGKLDSVVAHAEGYVVNIETVTTGTSYRLHVIPRPNSNTDAGVLLVRTNPAFGQKAGHRVFLWQLPEQDANKNNSQSEKVIE